MNKNFVIMVVFTILAFSVTVNASDIIFEDRFDSDFVSWIVESGKWIVRDGSLVCAESQDGSFFTGDPEWDDYTCELRMKTDSPGPKPWSVARILFRFTDSGNCYYVLLHTSGLLELGKEQDGKHIPGIASAKDAGNPLEWNTFKIEANSNNIKVYLNGQMKIDYKDEKPLEKGRFGLNSFQDSIARFDDVKISSVKLAVSLEKEKKEGEKMLKSFNYESSAKGNIAVFKDRDVPVRESKPSNPERIAGIFRKAGFGVTFLGAKEIVNSKVLSTRNFNVLVLPYGSAFPIEAIPSFKKFLRGKGNFISIGGYFADNLYGSEGGGKQDSLVENPGFENDIEGWSISHPGMSGLEITSDNKVSHSGKKSAKITVEEGTQITYYSLFFRLDDIKYKDNLRVEVWVKTKDVREGAGAYLALNYYKEDGQRIKWSQSGSLKGTSDWTLIKFIGEIPSGTKYATFTLILHGYGEAWFDDVIVKKGADVCLNTREGDTKGPGNSLRVSPEQIGVFDPGYKLTNVAELRASKDQFIIPSDFKLNAKVEGYSASGVFTGNGNPVKAEQNARPIYLVDAFDSFGRRRGSVVSMVRNYRGFYTGSDWAVFGANNMDLFSPEFKDCENVLTGIVESMISRVYIAEAHPEYACYRQGEKINLEAIIANYGSSDREVGVKFKILDSAGSKTPVYEKTIPAVIKKGGLSTVSTFWTPDKFDRDFYVVTAELLADGKTKDSLSNGFIVWDENVLKSGPDLKVNNSYLSRFGKNVFMCGTGDAGYPFYAESENPLLWDEQFRFMRDQGLLYYRCMHIFSFFPDETSGKKDFSTLDEVQQRPLRRLDALVQLTQKHGLMFLLVNNIGIQFAKDKPKELEAKQKFLRLLAKRYEVAPGLMFNLDHQEFIRAGTPESDSAFQNFLKEKYKTFDKLKEAWGDVKGSAFTDVKFDDRTAYNQPWDNRMGCDVGEFLYTYREAWRQNTSRPLHEGNPKVIFDQDFSLYWWPDYLWPGPETMKLLDMVSAHFYGDVKGFALQNKRADMQVMGKPLGQTEFGILTHPAWQGSVDVRLTDDSADAFFMQAGHYCLGLGATMMSNWNWKEMKECIFPWAIAYQDLVPKAHFLAYRNMAILFGTFSPEYRYPQVYVVVPNSSLLTSKVGQVDRALRNCISRLFSCHVNFGLIGEQYLNYLPKEAKALFYPIPYSISDEIFANLEKFVKGGGTLYFSGDISFDENRQRTKTERLQVLAGVKFIEQNFSDISVPVDKKGTPVIKVEPAGAQVLESSAQGPRVVYNKLGKGNVIYSIDPTELYAGKVEVCMEMAPSGESSKGAGTETKATGELYSLCLKKAGADVLPVSPDDPNVHIFKLSTQEGGTVYVLFNDDANKKDLTLKHEGHLLNFTMASGRPAFAHFNKNGELVAVEAQDKVSLDNSSIWSGKGHFIVVSLDGKPLNSGSVQILVMAVGEGEVQIESAVKISEPVVLYGEFKNRKWHTLKVESLKGKPTVKAGGELRSSIVLICGKGDESQPISRMEELIAR